MNFKFIFIVFLTLNAHDLEIKQKLKIAFDSNDKAAALEVLKDIQKSGNRSLLDLFSTMYFNKWGSTLTDLAIAHIEYQTYNLDLSQKISELNEQVESLIALAKSAGLIEWLYRIWDELLDSYFDTIFLAKNHSVWQWPA